MKKYIHYCWFGNKPLPRLAKKCIKSWKKYLPDYEIKEWNEKNFDINICPFIKQAYENKKWAFVSDYARLYALYNYGGVYFDTDMKVIKKCDKLLEDDFFIGYEENKIIAAGVIGVKKKEDKYIKELLNWYNEQKVFDNNNIFNYAIPKVITKIFSKYELKNTENIDIVDDNIKIYPAEYFYPINYNYSSKTFTKDTCMIHYYNATWVPKNEKIAIFFLRKFGTKIGGFLLNRYYNICNFKNRIKNRINNKISSLKYFLSVHLNYKKRVKKIVDILSQYKENKYIMIYHPDWMGLANVAKDNFRYLIPLREQNTVKEATLMAKAIEEANAKLVIFNGFAWGWDIIAKHLKELNPNIRIKVLWHGSNALLNEDYDFYIFSNILKLYKNHQIDEIAFVKKSMYEFYNKKGYNCRFVMNYVNIENKEQYKRTKEKDNKIHMGLYCSGDRWVKNTYNQLSAISLIEDSTIDCIPMNYKLSFLAQEFNLDFTSSDKMLSRHELFNRISKNDVNLYVTFTECAPLLPLESLELGVPCITGDNHHYFEGTKLEKYLVVSKEDNIIEIYNKIQDVLENKDYIMNLYKEWKQKYNIEARKTINDFLEENGGD